MWKRYTERARQVIVFAQEEARGFGHDHIATEHLLLGVLREEQGLGARVLRSLDITDERVATRLGESTMVDKHAVQGPISFTARASKALELAVNEADALGRATTSTHHLLLGLLRVSDVGTVRLLFELGARPEQVREQVLAQLSTAPEEWPTSMQQLAEFEADRGNRSGGTAVPRDLRRKWHEEALKSAREAYGRASTDRQRALAREQVEALESTTPLLSSDGL